VQVESNPPLRAWHVEIQGGHLDVYLDGNCDGMYREPEPIGIRSYSLAEVPSVSIDMERP
jgi:hypothetical protein